MNIMLTGATGHLGTHITNQAIKSIIFTLVLEMLRKFRRLAWKSFCSTIRLF